MAIDNQVKADTANKSTDWLGIISSIGNLIPGVVTSIKGSGSGSGNTGLTPMDSVPSATNQILDNSTIKLLVLGGIAIAALYLWKK
jgi:hypothetical protein